MVSWTVSWLKIRFVICETGFSRGYHRIRHKKGVRSTGAVEKSFILDCRIWKPRYGKIVYLPCRYFFDIRTKYKKSSRDIDWCKNSVLQMWIRILVVVIQFQIMEMKINKWRRCTWEGDLGFIMISQDSDKWSPMDHKDNAGGLVRPGTEIDP